MNTYLEEVKGHLQKLPAFLEKNTPFITSRYQKNKEAFNEIGLGLCVLFAVLCLVLLPYDSVELKEVIELFFKVVAGTALLFGAYFAWKRLEVNQEGQITERFTRAIDQLGATHSGDGRKNLEVRLGGIYALERIAKDSAKDHWAIMEVLTAYVREHVSFDQATTSSLQTVGINEDIQSILTVIGRRLQTYKNGEEECLNLSYTQLDNANLSQMNLNGAIFTRSSLANATLIGTSFNSAIFTGSCFDGARLDAAHLNRAWFPQAQLKKTYLSIAEIESASFWNANLEGSFLDGTSAKNANFSGSNLKDTSITGANLEGALFIGANLENADLSGARLNGANLENAALNGTRFIDADLKASIKLTKNQLQGAIFDRTTKLPDDLMNEQEWYEAQIERSAAHLAQE